ncbi:MAG: hypothetical protein WC455_00605 [Dehalococcoidia bacterium]|jgi:hypothetical protein
MKFRSLGKRIALCAIMLTLITISSGFIIPAVALADDEGIAMSGTFAGQKYVIPSGSSVTSSEIFVTVISGYQSSIGIQMTCVTPVGVNINLSKTNFTLAPDESQSISIEIQTTEDAAAGNYTISIKATPYITNPGGVQVLPEITQTASLSIMGESANVTINAISPDGTPVTAELRLFKLIEGRNQEVAYGISTLSLNAIVAPGTFLAQAYVGGQLLDEEWFEIAADEVKTIELTAGTIYFENPGLLPYYNNNTGELAFINIYYTLRNVYEPVDNVAIKLLVTLDGNTIEQKDHSTIPTLVIGRASGSIDYFPYSGNGEYGFTLQLFVDGNPYTNSQEMTFDVGDNGSSGSSGNSNIPLIVGIVCAVAILLGIAYFMIHRSRKAKHIHSTTKKKGTRRE